MYGEGQKVAQIRDGHIRLRDANGQFPVITVYPYSLHSHPFCPGDVSPRIVPNIRHTFGFTPKYVSALRKIHGDGLIHP